MNRINALAPKMPGSPDVPTAVYWLKEAISLHEDHMSGRAPTTGKEGRLSQTKMMRQMKSALQALSGSGTANPLMGGLLSGDSGHRFSM